MAAESATGAAAPALRSSCASAIAVSMKCPKLLTKRARSVSASGSARHSAAWFSVDDCAKLAFDHSRILRTALERLRGKVRYQPIGFELLPPKFTLRQLQDLYEKVLDRPLDKRNFRKKILGMGFLVALDEVQKDVAHRAARLYRFDHKKYQRLQKRGFNFEI